jgi:glycosyltransferase involved in cell wall biosynthesis
VRLAGPHEYGRRYAELFDVFASPSRMEGFGIAVLEAMVQKVCPLVSNVGGLTELVRHEKDGLVVPPEDPPAIADAIRSLYHDANLRQRLANSAHRRSSSEFSIAAWTQRIENVYRDLAGARAANAA